MEKFKSITWCKRWAWNLMRLRWYSKWVGDLDITDQLYGKNIVEITSLMPQNPDQMPRLPRVNTWPDGIGKRAMHEIKALTLTKDITTKYLPKARPKVGPL